MRIIALDERQFPCAFPSLHLLLAQYRIGDHIVEFGVDEAIDPMLPGKTGYGAAAVLEDGRARSVVMPT